MPTLSWYGVHADLAGAERQGGIDQPDLHLRLRLGDLEQRVVQRPRVGADPVVPAEVADDVDGDALVRVFVGQLHRLLDAANQVGVDLRRLQVVDLAVGDLQACRVVQPFVDLRLVFRVGDDARHQDEGEAVVGRGLADALEDVVLNDVLLGDREARPDAVVVAVLVGHAQVVVEDDDVQVVLLGDGDVGEVDAEEAQHEQRGEGDEEAAQQQQDELLDDQPAAAALLRLEQELHRRPVQALEAHAVDQVDDDRRADEGRCRPPGRRGSRRVRA